LTEYQRIDLALDPFPYNGGLTSMPLKLSIFSGCESRPANRSLGRKQPERWRR
jgi:hypothetical protein